jgi:hypothetical protein
MQVELLRRLGRFIEADEALRLLRTEKDLQQGIAARLIAIESELVERKNASPQPLPSLPPLDRFEEDPAFVAAARLDGFASFNESFSIEHADLGSLNGKPHSLHLSIHSRRDRPLDSVWWSNFTKDGEPQFDWHQFLAVHEQAEKLVERNPWLAEWKAETPGRSVELLLAGLQSSAASGFDDFVPPWREAGFKHLPVVQLILRKEHSSCADVFLAEDGGGIVTSVSKECVSKHWLTAEEFWFHPQFMSPTYLRIDPDGRWERRVMGKKR